MEKEITNCVFCRIIKRELEASIVYEDEQVIAIMDLQPVNPGHVLVIPKVHIPFIDHAHDEVGAYLFKIGIRINQALKASSIPCEGVNYLLADGEAAGQEVFHAHLHVFPRFKADGFGFRFSEKYYAPTERQELDRIASEIKKQII
jgi:histidine triad (HIT) family protein